MHQSICLATLHSRLSNNSSLPSMWNSHIWPWNFFLWHCLSWWLRVDISHTVSDLSHPSHCCVEGFILRLESIQPCVFSMFVNKKGRVEVSFYLWDCRHNQVEINFSKGACCSFGWPLDILHLAFPNHTRWAHLMPIKFIVCQLLLDSLVLAIHQQLMP
jgi:hypothetical protein